MHVADLVVKRREDEKVSTLARVFVNVSLGTRAAREEFRTEPFYVKLTDRSNIFI